MHKSKRQQNLPMAKVASADAEIKLPRSGQIKDDHPVVQLTTRNYVDFMYGFIGHMSSKRVGGADVKFYLQNEGAEPDFNSESAELKSEFSTMDRNRHVLMSKTKRLEQKLATANNLLQSATAELSKIKKQLKRRTPIPSSQDPDLQDDDLPFNASRHMDDQSVSSIGSFNANHVSKVLSKLHPSAHIMCLPTHYLVNISKSMFYSTILKPKADANVPVCYSFVSSLVYFFIMLCNPVPPHPWLKAGKRFADFIFDTFPAYNVKSYAQIMNMHLNTWQHKSKVVYGNQLQLVTMQIISKTLSATSNAELSAHFQL